MGLGDWPWENPGDIGGIGWRWRDRLGPNKKIKKIAILAGYAVLFLRIDHRTPSKGRAQARENAVPGDLELVPVLAAFAVRAETVHGWPSGLVSGGSIGRGGQPAIKRIF
jgi:hypothetical protein